MSPTYPRPRSRSALARSLFACLTFTVAGGAVPATAAAQAPEPRVRNVEVLRIRNIPAATAATLIRPALSDAAQVALDDRTSALVVNDYPENMERVRAVLRAVDEKAPGAGAARAGAPAAAAASDAAASVKVEAENESAVDAELADVLDRHQTYRAYRDKLLDLDQDLAALPFGNEHPKAKAMQAKREALRRQLDDVREEIRMRLVGTRAEELRGGSRRVGVAVTRATPVVTRQLKLPWGSGLVVERVTPGSAAEAAGLMPYDVLYRLDGQLLVNAEQLDVLVGALEAGKEVQLELYRDGEALKRTMKVPPATTTNPAR